MIKTIPYPAPNFSLPDATGTLRSLNEFAGRWIVLYFYPKDDTPGCTTEACSLRDVSDEFVDLDATVIGVSRDDATSHQAFSHKYHLNFTLLSDTDHAVMSAYGAWGTKMFGKEGVLRKTFIIDPKGEVVKVYPRVTPLGHGGQVIADLRALRKLAS